MEESAQPYHHDNLQQTLLDIAFEQARKQGPAAINLRAIAREAGVSPTAIYRHYPDQAALYLAVKRRIIEELATHMRTRLASQSMQASVNTVALTRLRLLCAVYLDFALDEPGLFRTAGQAEASQNISLDELTHNAPFMLLKEAFDALCEAGYINPRNKLAGQLALWSAIHGQALLLLDGPLQHLPRPEKQAIAQQTTEIVLRGILESR